MQFLAISSKIGDCLPDPLHINFWDGFASGKKWLYISLTTMVVCGNGSMTLLGIIVRQYKTNDLYCIDHNKEIQAHISSGIVMLLIMNMVIERATVDQRIWLKTN